MMNAVTCPRCGKEFVKRTHRSGLFEELASLAFVYPFRCQLCDYRFLGWQWGVRYQRVSVDRREYERFPVHLPIELTNHWGTFHGKTLDLSLGGCAADAEGMFLVGTESAVRLHIPDGPPIRIETAVVRSLKLGRIGVEFQRCEPAEQRRLGSCIEKAWKSRLRTDEPNGGPVEAGQPTAQSAGRAHPSED